MNDASDSSQATPLNTNSRLPAELLWAMPVQERMVKLNWLGNMWRSDSGAPYLAADFIGRLGRGVCLVDVREADELTGPTGHVPGSQWVPMTRIAELPELYPASTPVVLVSRNGGVRGADDLTHGTGPAGQVPVSDPGRMRVLLLDAVVYANLGLLDAALSHLFADGGFALLNYSYLFVNAALMVPSAAATVVGLRTAASGDPDAHALLRRWAVLGGLVCAGLVVVVGVTLGWGPVARQVDAAVGWSLAGSIGGLVMWSAPYAGLRLANTIGRQYVIASEPRRVIVWDLTGLLGRALILGLGASVLGLVASPIGLAFAEVVQLGAWWRRPPRVT